MASVDQHSDKELSAKEWENKFWKSSDDPPFHIPDVHESVLKFYSQLFGDRERGRVFIPLCGKSLDMIYFADKGHEVVGVEFSENATEAFFKENNLTYSKLERNDSPFVVYKANEKNITIFRGDFFAVNKDLVGKFDACWDRGSFEAINVSQRKQYIDLVVPMMKPNSKYLLSCLTYDKSRFNGPPHDVSREFLEETFGRSCSIELLQSVTIEPGMHIKKFLDEWTAHDYLFKFK